MKEINGIEHCTAEEMVKAGKTLKPNVCILCGEPNQVIYVEVVCDCYCEMCGSWQNMFLDEYIPEMI